MSHSRAISLRFAIIEVMSRLALFALCVTAAACSKSAGNQDKVSAAPTNPSPAGQEAMAMPTQGPGGLAKPMPSMGRPAEADPAGAPAGGGEDPFKLKPEEGKLTIELPADAKAGGEAIAKIRVTPGSGYHVNLEYPVKLTLTQPDGVTLAKTTFVAGGRDKSKGDADALDENQLALSVKMTPAASGSYTVNGTFKFAVCDVSQCLAKKETIAIALAAK
jgi:hypothetical protein